MPGRPRVYVAGLRRRVPSGVAIIEPAAFVLIGFSWVAAAVLLAAGPAMAAGLAQTRAARALAALLILGLAALQAAHWLQLAGRADVFASPVYVALLGVVAPAFYLCFLAVLRPALPRRQLLWFVPAAILPWLPAAIAIPLPFVLGVGFALHLAVLVGRLQAQRRHFRLEKAAFVAHAAVALAVLPLGAAAPWLGVRLFVLIYACLIGLAFALALYVLLRFPDLGAKAAEAVATAYAVSTLAKVDRERALAALQRLMDEERVYADETLSLAGLAKAVELTPHQLSELVNTQLGVGFSRWVRQHRVAAAQRMLLAEPEASVLSVGLSVGFTSQSNFYAAFREITGDVPGRYRRQQQGAGPA